MPDSTSFEQQPASMLLVLDGSPRCDRLHGPAAFLHLIGGALANRVGSQHDAWDCYLHILQWPWGPLCLLTQDTYSFHRAKARRRRFFVALDQFLEIYAAQGARFASLTQVGEFRWCNGILRWIFAQEGYDVVNAWPRNEQELRDLVRSCAAKA